MTARHLSPPPAVYRVLLALLGAGLAWLFFTQSPIEALRRPWTGPHVSEDGWYYYHYLRSAVVSGDLDLRDDYHDVGNWYGFGVTSTGQQHNPFPVGPAILWTPGFLLGRAAASLVPTAPTTVPDGMRPLEQAGALATSLVAGIWACWTAFGLARRHVPDSAAWSGMLVAFVGGPLIWYAVYSPSMPHALEAGLGTAFFTSLLPLRRRTNREAVWLGALGGVMLLVRPQLATFYVPLLYEALVVFRRHGVRAALAPMAICGAVTLLCVAPQLLLWKHVYGQFLVVPQGSGFMRFGESMWVDTLFSSRNGLFTTTPVIWFVMPGLYFVWRRNRETAVVLGLSLLLQAFVNGAAWDWWGGGAFGGRRFSGTFVVWVVSLACLLAWTLESGRWRLQRAILAVAVVAPLLVLQVLMMRAHHAHRFSWEYTVPFEERFTAATGLRAPVLSRLGNPFGLPASLLFAWPHGVALNTYDRSVGPYLLDERLPTTNPLWPSARVAGVDFTDDTSRPFVGRGFVRTQNGAQLDGPDGDLFVPLNRPGGLDLSITSAGGVDVQWTFNGHALSGPRMHVEAAWIRRGINVLKVRGTGVVVRELRLEEGPDWPPAWARAYPQTP